MSLVKRFAETVSCFSFNGDKSKLALCPNNNEIHIYAKAGKDWKREVVLTEHTEVVTGLDWGANTNRIVSCSQDRNAYVWTLEGKVWKPTLVILRLNRAATYVQWSPKEDKFAVASGAKLVSICYFEEENDWWVSKHVKKHRSTILSVKWHPNNMLIATACSDFKARVFSAWTKGVDKRGSTCPIPDVGKKAEKFGECLLEFDCGGWVKDVDWSPSGNLVAWVGQDSSLSVADITQPGNVTTSKLPRLPLARLLFVSENRIVAAGYDCEPFVFEGASGSPWKETRSLDQKQAKAANKSTMKMWQDRVDKGKADASAKLKTKHQNAITWLAMGEAGKLVSSGLDGKMIWWTV